MHSRRLTVAAVAALLACSACGAPAQIAPATSPAPSTSGPSTSGSPRPEAPASGPSTPESSTSGSPARGSSAPEATPPVASIKLGALLPLTGPGAWFGAEIKQGLELAAAELDPMPKRGVPFNPSGASEPGAASGGRDASASAPAIPAGGRSAAESEGRPSAGGPTAPGRPPGSPAAGTAATGRSGDAQEVPPASPGASSAGAASTSPVSTGEGTGTETKKPAAPLEAVEPPDRPRDVALVVQAADVQPLDVRSAETEAVKLLGSGVAAIVTASPTPTLTAYPLASGRDVLVLHAGLATDRFPATSRTLLQLRPSVAARAEVLTAHAWQRGIRRLAVLSGGDAFGRAVRAAASARWRQAGGHLVHDESVSLDSSDLRTRLRAASRTGPDAILLGYQGAALGDMANALRGAGYAGQLLAVDDDRAALLAGGPALDGALVLSDAFVPVPGSRGARFAKAYEAHTGSPPSRFAASAYEAATLLATAAGRVARGGRGVTGSRLRDALVAERTFPSLYAGELIVRDDGTIGRPLALFKVDGGKLAFESYVGLDGAVIPAPTEPTP